MRRTKGGGGGATAYQQFLVDNSVGMQTSQAQNMYANNPEESGDESED